MVPRLLATPWPCLVSALVVFLGWVVLHGVKTNDVVEMIAFGVIAAQGAALAIYVCFSVGEFWRRLCPFLAGLVVLAAAILRLNPQTGSLQESAKEMLEIVGIAPLVLGAAQFPLWLVRIFASWRLSPPGVPLERDSAWSIRDLLVGTFLCALILAGPQWRTPPDPKAMDLYWPVVTGLAIFAAGATLASVPPAIWLVLRRPGGGRGAAAFLIIAAFVFLAVFSGFAVAYGVWEWRPFRFIGMFVTTFAISLLLPLWGCYALGFRLVTRWDKAAVQNDPVTLAEPQ